MKNIFCKTSIYSTKYVSSEYHLMLPLFSCKSPFQMTPSCEYLFPGNGSFIQSVLVSHDSLENDWCRYGITIKTLEKFIKFLVLFNVFKLCNFKTNHSQLVVSLSIIIVEVHCKYCHNPTNNPKQLKTTFVGVVL